MLGYVSVVCMIYNCALALLNVSSRSYWQRLSEAQLRLASNRPCMTLVIYIYQFAHSCTVYVGLAQARPNYGTSVTRNYIPSDLYGHKREIFYCAFSCLGHGPYTRRSDLANCKFTLVLVLIKQVPRRHSTAASRSSAPKEETLSEIEPVISSVAQGPAKNTIKID